MHGKMSKRSPGRSRIKIGMNERVITPPLGGEMAGFGIRKGVSQGVHDDLHARCMVVESSETAVAVLSASVVGLNQEIIDDTRKEVSARTGMPAFNIMMAATHTHSGPKITKEYTSLLKQRCIDCLMDAWKHRKPGRIGIGVARVEDVGVNRRRLDYGGLPVDFEVGIIKIEETSGKIKGVIFNYACHPTTMGPDNLLISEDWVHYAVKTIKKNVPNNPIVMFLNGAEGDINPGYSAGLSAIGAKIPIRTWEYAEKIGARMGRAVSEKLAGIKTKSVLVVKSVSKNLDLPLRRSFSITEKEAKERQRAARNVFNRLKRSGKAPQVVGDRAEVALYFASMVRDQAKNFYSKAGQASLPVELQSLRLDDAVLTTFPGEVFVEVGLEVKRQSPFRKNLVIGLANTGRTAGYMPTKEAFGEGDYEVYTTRYAEEASDALIQATLDQMAMLV